MVQIERVGKTKSIFRDGVAHLGTGTPIMPNHEREQLLAMIAHWNVRVFREIVIEGPMTAQDYANVAWAGIRIPG